MMQDRSRRMSALSFTTKPFAIFSLISPQLELHSLIAISLFAVTSTDAKHVPARKLGTRTVESTHTRTYRTAP
jgi:hypothetical protein